MTVGQYEMVVGLETHVELKTDAKIFCGCSAAFGGAPNTQCCPVCMGLPGTLPVLNRQAVYYAVKAGLALNCRIDAYSKMDRKNYFYPDLPKAYQISQYDLPLCRDGYLDLETSEGPKRIGITRIHMEEDAGKLIHREGEGALIDYNRCGVPLIEIVSQPDFRRVEEIKAYLRKLRATLLYTGVSDCKMNEGSLRVDVNLSVRKKGEKTLGVRTEMKNLNSFQFIAKAVEYEFRRQTEALEAGEEIVQETRRFEQVSGRTLSMRKKEDAHDYRYFPEPDLPPIIIAPELLERLRKEIPPLPDQRKKEYVKRFGLTPYAAEQLTLSREAADFFEQAAEKTSYPKLAANLVLSEVFRLMSGTSDEIPVAPEHLAKLADLFGEGRINSSACRQVLSLLWEKNRDPETLVAEQGLEQISDREVLSGLADQVLSQREKMVRDYHSGKTAALQALIGQMMKQTRGKGDPAAIREILLEKLGKSEP